MSRNYQLIEYFTIDMIKNPKKTTTTTQLTSHQEFKKKCNVWVDCWLLARIFAGSMFSVNTVLWIEQSLLLLAFRLYWFWNTPCCKQWEWCQIVRGWWNKIRLKDFSRPWFHPFKKLSIQRETNDDKSMIYSLMFLLFLTFKLFSIFPTFSWKFLLSPTFCFWLITRYVMNVKCRDFYSLLNLS